MTLTDISSSYKEAEALATTVQLPGSTWGQQIVNELVGLVLKQRSVLEYLRLGQRPDSKTVCVQAAKHQAGVQLEISCSNCRHSSLTLFGMKKHLKVRDTHTHIRATSLR